MIQRAERDAHQLSQRDAHPSGSPLSFYLTGALCGGLILAGLWLIL